MEFEQSETVEWFIEDKATLALKRHKTPESILKKTQDLVDMFNKLFSKTRSAFKQERVFHRALELATYSLLALGKRTITGILSAGGKLFQITHQAGEVEFYHTFTCVPPIPDTLHPTSYKNMFSR